MARQRSQNTIPESWGKATGAKFTLTGGLEGPGLAPSMCWVTEVGLLPSRVSSSTSGSGVDGWPSTRTPPSGGVGWFVGWISGGSLAGSDLDCVVLLVARGAIESD